MTYPQRKIRSKRSLFILCLLFAAMLSSGCERWNSLGIINHYPFPVEVYDATNLNYAPDLLGVIGPGATLQTQILAHGGARVYRFTINRVHGKVIKQMTEPAQTINDKGTLVIGR